MTLLDSYAPYEQASPTLLAMQPPTVPDKNERPDEDWNQIFSYLESRLGMLRTVRYSWWTHWAQLAEYILPKRYHWLVVAHLWRRGSPIHQQVNDSTAPLPRQHCSSVLGDRFMPATLP